MKTKGAVIVKEDGTIEPKIVEVEISKLDETD